VRTLRLLLLAALALHVMVAEAGVAQASACLTNADTVSMHVKNVTRIVTAGDSALLVQQGIPYRPAGGVSLVTDTLTCRSIVNAYNALDSTPSTNISRAYVLRVGTTAYAMAEGAPPFVYYFWDTAYQCLAALATM
jgi:hypothetical protein